MILLLSASTYLVADNKLSSIVGFSGIAMASSEGYLANSINLDHVESRLIWECALFSFVAFLKLLAFYYCSYVLSSYSVHSVTEDTWCLF